MRKESSLSRTHFEQETASSAVGCLSVSVYRPGGEGRLFLSSQFSSLMELLKSNLFFLCSFPTDFLSKATQNTEHRIQNTEYSQTSQANNTVRRHSQTIHFL